LCGFHKVLTFEHLPAESSFNSEPVEMFGLESWLNQASDGSMTGGERMERGAGAHTLCSSCNSGVTGGLYVAELKKWTHAGLLLLQTIYKNRDVEEGNAVKWTLPNAYPARFLKQLIAMLASVNASEFLDHHPDLREFVLNRDAVGLPPRYQFYLTLVHPKSSVARFAGASPRIAYGSWSPTWVTDLVWPPFAYIMTIDEPAPVLPLGNIISFANRKYNEREEITLQLQVVLGEQPYPGEFTDPLQRAEQPQPFPSASSFRLPVELLFANGQRFNLELAHPTRPEEWTGPELHEIVKGLLRILVGKDEMYGMVAIWGELGLAIQVRSARGIATTAPQPVSLGAIGVFTGNDDVPARGICPLLARLEAAPGETGEPAV
jgi:hypothetical protein